MSVYGSRLTICHKCTNEEIHALKSQKDTDGYLIESFSILTPHIADLLPEAL